MRDQLDALEELAKTDLAHRQIDVELAEIESNVAALREDVDRIRALLDRERQQLHDAEQLRAGHLSELEAIAEKAQRSRKRQESASKTREIEALQRELEEMKRQKEERTAEAERLSAVTSEVRAQIERHEQEFAQLTEGLKSDEAAAERRSGDLRARRAEYQIARNVVTARVRADLLRIYNMVHGRRGTGVADCAGGICRGCNIALPPQLFNQVLGAQRVYQCPHCQRLLLPPNAAGR